MKLLKEALGVLGALVVLMAIVALVAPKRAHAVVAALVQVTNTNSNPVPTQDVGKDLATNEWFECSTSETGSEVVSCEPFTVPAGQRFVIDEIDGFCVPAAGQSIQSGGASFIEGGAPALPSFAMTPEGTAGGSALYAYNVPTHYVVDPGSPITFLAITTGTGLSSCHFGMNGHVVTVP